MYNDKLTKSLAEAVKKCMGEELKGNQHKIDVNKNNKIDAEDFKHLRAGKKPVEEAMQKSDVPAYLRKQQGDKPLSVADVKGPRPDSISSKEALAKLRNEDVEEFEMLDEEQLDELDTSTLKSYAKKANKQIKTMNKVVDDNRGKLPKPVNKAISQQQHKRDVGIERANSKISDRAMGIKKEETEQLQEYESKNGVYRHQGTYGRAKDPEAGETDWDKEEKGEPTVKAKKPRKLGARQNFVRSKRVNEGFSSMLNAYEQGGIKGLFESFIKEEPTNDEFKKELDKAQAKSEGKEKSDIAKAAVQSVQQEEVEQLDELSPGTLKSYVNKAKPEMKAAKDERQSAREVGDYKTAGTAGDTVNKRTAGIKAAKAKLNAEEVEQVEERTLTEPEAKKKEEIVKSMKKGIQGFKDRYGADAKSVMYATATARAKEKA